MTDQSAKWSRKDMHKHSDDAQAIARERPELTFSERLRVASALSETVTIQISRKEAAAIIRAIERGPRIEALMADIRHCEARRGKIDASFYRNVVLFCLWWPILVNIIWGM